MTASPNTKSVARDWYEIHRVSDGISLIRETHVATWLRCNIWHVRGREYDLLIDTGMGLRPLKKEIARLTEKPVKAVMTHSHFDHMGGAHEFDCRLGHAAEADIHAHPTADNTAGWPAFVRAETFSALPHDGFTAHDYFVRAAPLTGHLDEGDVIDLGDRHLKIFHLPGHSPGSIALLEEKTGTLFSGDVIYDGELFDTVYHSDPEIYRESLARLRELPITTIHGGHDDSFGPERMNEIIDLYNAGKGRIEDAYAWVNAKL